jgi:type III secretion system YscJ/HrcJ family lipoprotein
MCTHSAKIYRAVRGGASRVDDAGGACDNAGVPGRGFPLLLLVVAACQSIAARGLGERESQQALAALGAAGIGATREPDGDRTWRIEVGGGDTARAAQVLWASGLPRPEKQGWKALYGSGSLVPTAAEDRARHLDALGGEIGAHLLSLDGVADASVIVSESASDPLVPAPVKRAASVVIRLAPEAAPGWTVDDARRLVAAAADGLDPERVTVVLLPTRAVPAAPPLSSIGPIQVATSSRGLLVAVLTGALVLIVLLGGGLVYVELRRARRGASS